MYNRDFLFKQMKHKEDAIDQDEEQKNRDMYGEKQMKKTYDSNE